jgi:ABC-type Zn uptake system ZnuABC Zn-binding protein ZnuA
MKKTLMLLATTSFIAFYSCQSTKTETAASEADSTSLETTVAPIEESMPADSTLSSDSTEIITTDSIQ